MIEYGKMPPDRTRRTSWRARAPVHHRFDRGAVDVLRALRVGRVTESNRVTRANSVVRTVDITCHYQGK
jgi:hypothetical protein